MHVTRLRGLRPFTAVVRGPVRRLPRSLNVHGEHQPLLRRQLLYVSGEGRCGQVFSSEPVCCSPADELTARLPTATHLCLAHVLSVRNVGTDAGTLEVWGGPLAGGKWALGLLNRGAAAATIPAPFAVFGGAGVGPASQFCVRDAWTQVR